MLHICSAIWSGSGLTSSPAPGPTCVSHTLSHCSLRTLIRLPRCRLPDDRPPAPAETPPTDSALTPPFECAIIALRIKKEARPSQRPFPWQRWSSFWTRWGQSACSDAECPRGALRCVNPTRFAPDIHSAPADGLFGATRRVMAAQRCLAMLHGGWCANSAESPLASLDR